MARHSYLAALAACLLCGTAFGAPHAFAQEEAEAEPVLGVNSLREALELALRSNPSLQIQEGVEDEARSELDNARSLGNVRVDLSATAGLQNTDSNSPFSFQEGMQGLVTAQLTATKPVWTSGRIPSAIRSARSSVTAAEWQTEGARQSLILEVVSAYSDLRLARQTVSIRENNVSVSGEQRQAAEDRFEVGEITRTDVALANARVEGARAFLAAAEAELAAAEARFTAIVGAPAGELLPLPPRPDLPESFEFALELALDSNPILLAADANLEAAREGVNVAKAAYGPQVSVVGRASAQEVYDDNIRDTSVALLGQASIPLYDGDQLRSRTRGAQARVRQAQSAVDQGRRDVIASMSAAWARMLAADRAVEASAAQVTAADTAYEGAKLELSVGQRTTLDVLDTEQDLFDARLGLASAERDAYVAAYQVLAAMGMLDTERLPAIFND